MIIIIIIIIIMIILMIIIIIIKIIIMMIIIMIIIIIIIIIMIIIIIGMQSPPYSTIPRPRPKGLPTICVEYLEGETKSVRLCEAFRSNYI